MNPVFCKNYDNPRVHTVPLCMVMACGLWTVDYVLVFL